MKLEVNDCNLKHICPRYGRLEYFTGYTAGFKNHISVKQNVALKHLSFVPTKILSVPKTRDRQKKAEERTTASKGRLILTTDRSFQDTKRWKTKYKIHDYDFILKQSHEKVHKCQCCARCGTQCNDQLGIIETFMVMDFTQIVETPASETNTGKEAINESGPGEWKTLVKTKMCSECINQIKLDVLLHYDDIPLKHKTCEKVMNSGAFTEAHPKVQPFAQPFSLPFQISNMDVSTPECDNRLQFLQSSSGFNIHERVNEYTQMDGSIRYEEPQKQNSFFDYLNMDTQEEIYNSGVPIHDLSGHDLNWNGSNQQYHNNQFNPMEVPQSSDYYDNKNGVILQNLNSHVFVPQQSNVLEEQLQNFQNYFFTDEVNDEEFDRNEGGL
uniref:Uncharacterized protein n=1 Tax=Panagrolaimus superbus TaxID=310955 RepID=A0A914XZ07_9BILA